MEVIYYTYLGEPTVRDEQCILLKLLYITFYNRMKSISLKCTKTRILKKNFVGDQRKSMSIIQPQYDFDFNNDR